MPLFSDSTLNIFFAGDFCSKPSTRFIQVTDELQNTIQGCDLGIINFEVPLKPNVTLPKQARERFFQHDDVPEFLRNLGFHLFSIANNHTFDWDEPGFRKTKEALGNSAFGAGTYEEAYSVKVVEIKGKKIGFLAISFAAYKGVFDDVMRHDGLGCAYINDLKVNHVIIEAKKNVDYLFVLPHDGIEYIDAPLPETMVRYRDFIDYGADGVIASHPHCPQGWEDYKGKLIFYSLGNFFFNSKTDPSYRAWNRPHWYEGRGVVLTIDGDNLSWKVINTKNVDNVRIEIDHSEKSQEHNETICSYLSNQDSYQKYLLPQLAELNHANMKKIDVTCHADTIKDSIMAMGACLKRKLMKQRPQPDDQLKPLFQHDLFRYAMLRMIKRDISYNK